LTTSLADPLVVIATGAFQAIFAADADDVMARVTTATRQKSLDVCMVLLRAE
jgi:hypothetical protein